MCTRGLSQAVDKSFIFDKQTIFGNKLNLQFQDFSLEYEHGLFDKDQDGFWYYQDMGSR